MEKKLLLVTLTFSISCVAPPDYTDGLLENIPAIIDEPDYFSLSLLGQDYTNDHEWELSFSALDSNDVLLETIALKDLNINSGSSYLYIITSLNDSLNDTLNWIINNNMIDSREDSIKNIGTPSKVIFSGDNFSGRLEYQIMKQ
tara:strand:- start:49 stop:480 length:432 start_codon:yes stop_codon:yes gene_type:complete